jgi:hypothetical protein
VGVCEAKETFYYESPMVNRRKMTVYPQSTALILVCFLPAPRDMEIIRLLGWYRIPLRTAPKVIAVDYLAFYQSGAFGTSHSNRIETFAEVQGHELTTRAELFRDQPEHPRANEEYFKIQIGPVQTLDQPILANRWKRITFLYTTGDLFQKAHIVNDLVVRDPEREVLWHSLRERALKQGQYQPNDLPEDQIDLDPAILKMLGAITGFSPVDGPDSNPQD